MKKQYLAVAFLAVALGLTACSSKKADTETTTAQAVESTEAASSETIEEEYYYGYVSLVEDKIITVTDDEGNIAKFDVTDAQITGTDQIGEGDEVEVGCGTVLNPGSVVGSHSNIYPLSSVRGFVPANSIYKKQGEVVEKY